MSTPDVFPWHPVEFNEWLHTDADSAPLGMRDPMIECMALQDAERCQRALNLRAKLSPKMRDRGDSQRIRYHIGGHDDE